jgi:hypothetical protein
MTCIAHREVLLMLPLLLVSVAVVVLSVETGAEQQSADPSKTITMVTAEGCVDGRSLKMARPAGIEDAERIVHPVYRLKGSKQVADELKGLEGKPVRVRGELTDVPGEPAGTMIGGTKLTLGTGPNDPIAPTVARSPSPPTIVVQSITALEGSCGGTRPAAGASRNEVTPSTASASVPAVTAAPTPPPGAPLVAGHYLFAWTGDASKKGNDYLAVIDADPSSASYGRLVTTVGTDQQTSDAHHTEYVMPESGMLFANDHYSGRSFIFDVRDPMRPKIAGSFTDMAGYMHPHSYVRLPNGHVLATFQHAHHSTGTSELGVTGGLVEMDDAGSVVRSASSADPAFSNALLTPYSLVVLPGLDRIVSTNSSMHLEAIFAGATYQVWRLSDLKLLHTAYFDVGQNHYAHVSPEEPRLGPDGSIFVQTLGCGIERITGLRTDDPRSQLVHTFPGNWCGVPTIVGHFLIQSVPAIHGLIVLDITNGAEPMEVARLKINDTFEPHWTGWDAKGGRLVVTGSEPRLYLLKLDERSGALSLDEAFHDTDGKPGVSFDNRQWPHGWTGTGTPHGVVFSQ